MAYGLWYIRNQPWKCWLYPLHSTPSILESLWIRKGQQILRTRITSLGSVSWCGYHAFDHNVNSVPLFTPNAAPPSPSLSWIFIPIRLWMRNYSHSWLFFPRASWKKYRGKGSIFFVLWNISDNLVKAWGSGETAMITGEDLRCSTWWAKQNIMKKGTWTYPCFILIDNILCCIWIYAISIGSYIHIVVIQFRQQDSETIKIVDK